MAAKKAFSRLPTAIKPLHYSIRVKPDLTAFTFKGWMNVDLEVVQDTNKIVVNALDLQVVSLKLGSTPLDKYQICEKTETLTVDLPNSLKAGEKTNLLCSYTGILNDRLKGFYRSKYTTESGEERYCATTQFEATDARRCFPCWDEPSVKATFSISVIAPKDRTVLSNMPEVPSDSSSAVLDPLAADDLGNDLKLVQFGKSPIMSTYLVAIIVGEFEYVEGQTTNGKSAGVKVRAYTPIGKKEQGRFALETSIKALEFYTEFFDITYPLPKYDCIAIPDFECGAMENWGLVTYRETCILVDPKSTSSDTKQFIAIVVNHEMAHQWFGNLVTMEWWTHLWLNEGFASFMENLCTHTLFPEFDMWTQFVADTLIPALDLDALENSHPIEVPVGHPSEVDEIFDNISYNKGASVLRMLFDYVGKDAFRKGLHGYLKKFAYKNTETPDLWNNLVEASGKPITEVMGTWTSQMGFPIITVERAEQEGQEMVLSLRQDKFNADGSKASGNYAWKIPLKVVTRSNLNSPTSFLMEGETMQIRVPCAAGDWIHLNDDFMGYYRVKYLPEQLNAFLPDLATKKLSELNRLNILNDVMAQIKAGTQKSDVVLKMIADCVSEDSYVVWASVNKFLSKIRVLLKAEDCFEDFNHFLKNIHSEIVDKVGWNPRPNEHHTQSLLRGIIISRMGVLGHEPTVKEAQQRFQKHFKKEDELAADLRDPVYRTVASSGDNSTFEDFLKLYRESDSSEEKDRLARSMGSFKDPVILDKVLKFSISNEVRSQDTPWVVGSVAANPKGTDMAWAFFRSNFALFQERYQTGQLMQRLIQFTTEPFATEAMAQEVTQFFAEKGNPAERTISQSVEGIRLKSAWLQRDRDNIKAFLKSQM